MRAHTSHADDIANDDPRPTPPVEPELEDCCGSGCVPCIFDIYEQERERYAEALSAWEARQARGAAKNDSKPSKK